MLFMYKQIKKNDANKIMNTFTNTWNVHIISASQLELC